MSHNTQADDPPTVAPSPDRVRRLPPRPVPPERRRFYLSIPDKFVLALLLAVAWTTFSVWLSQGWRADLGEVTHPVFALVVIVLIAHVPGFMNAFLLGSLLFDSRPVRVRPDVYPPVTVLVAAYNEAAHIGHTIRSLAGQHYPGPLEVLILNDGSTDANVAMAEQAIAKLGASCPVDFRVLDYTPNAGKSVVLNRGLAHARHALVATLDADCWLREDAMAQVVERILSDPAHTQAVAGAVLVRNSRTNFLTRAQEWDYFHGIAAVKRMQSMYQGVLVAQGAFSLYRRAALEAVGGWPDCVGEDIVVSWAMLRRDWRIGYAEDAVCFTNAPTTLRAFALQRKRWSRGLIEAFKAHGRLLFKPRLTTLFVWWNLCFLPLDLIYTLVFIPGLILALFGVFWIAGPITLAVLPLAAFWNLFIYRIQSRMFRESGLKVRRNFAGFLFYAVGYSLMMQPISVWGYGAELLGARKQWGGK